MEGNNSDRVVELVTGLDLMEQTLSRFAGLHHLNRPKVRFVDLFLANNPGHFLSSTRLSFGKISPIQ